jgi:hypothetical protein
VRNCLTGFIKCLDHLVRRLSSESDNEFIAGHKFRGMLTDPRSLQYDPQ